MGEGSAYFSVPLQNLSNASLWQLMIDLPVPVPLVTHPYLSLHPCHQIQSLPYINKVLNVSLIDFPLTWEEWMVKSYL